MTVSHLMRRRDLLDVGEMTGLEVYNGLFHTWCCDKDIGVLDILQNIIHVCDYFLILADHPCFALFSTVSMLLCSCYVLAHCQICYNIPYDVIIIYYTIY